ncbi:MAG: RluA family pseudouridine synthase [bacterium]
MSNSKIKVLAEDGGKRLDIFLVGQFPEESRSFWQKQIKSGAVSVNGEQPSVHQFLKIGDEVEIIKTKKHKNIKTKTIKYKLVFECADYLVVEKPVGLLTHSAACEPGMADQIIKDYPEIKKVGDDLPAEVLGATKPNGFSAVREVGGRWGIVHRLDKDASGLLVVARTPKFFENIKKQFKERQVKKIYLALVYGEIAKDEDILEFAIGRAESGRMAARAEGEEGREAKTRINVLKRFKNYTYLSAQILTGRTHQIRTHLLAYGHGIVGDELYQTRKQKIKSVCDRLFLHSHILGFADAAGNYVEYESKLPKELENCLKNL